MTEELHMINVVKEHDLFSVTFTANLIEQVNIWIKVFC